MSQLCIPCFFFCLKVKLLRQSQNSLGKGTYVICSTNKEQQPELVPFSTCSSFSKHQWSRITSHASKVKNKCPEGRNPTSLGGRMKAKNAGNVLCPQQELSEWECLPGTTVLSRQRGNGSVCFPPKNLWAAGGKQREQLQRMFCLDANQNICGTNIF